MGIWVAAALTTIAAVLVVGATLARLTRDRRGSRVFLAVAAALTLPACAAALFWLREPLLHRAWLELARLAHPTLDDGALKKTLLYSFVRMLDAPLGEEPAKLWPLLLPWFRRELGRHEPVRVAMALGLGFGVGEIWVVAWLSAKSPAITALPFWAFGGFLVERLLVCFMHGAFTAAALRRWGNGFLRGFLLAAALHFAGNFPIFFRIVGVPSLSPAGWSQVLSLWVVVYALAMLAFLSRLLFGAVEPGKLLHGTAVCSSCGETYGRPLLLALNLGARRYERCSRCGKWQWPRTGAA